jgi:hypothetical protein
MSRASMTSRHHLLVVHFDGDDGRFFQQYLRAVGNARKHCPEVYAQVF